MDVRSGEHWVAQFPLTGRVLAGRGRDELSQGDQKSIESLVDAVDLHDDGARLIERGELLNSVRVLSKGYLLRTLETDGKRYVLGLHVPGDLVDFHGLSLKRLDHNVDAVGSVEVASFSHEALKRLLDERPKIARAMWTATLLDGAIHRKWIHILERLDAPRRIAHIYAELQARLDIVGLNRGRAVRTPFTQFDLADMCGVSAIHANRAVGKLRNWGIAEIRRGDLYTKDWEALKAFAQFDPSYLYWDGNEHRRSAIRL